MKDLLIGWKEIADYLRVSERTAMRYSKHRGFPVQRDRIGHPVAAKSTVDEWRIKQVS